MERQKVTAIVPAFNEAANIVECLNGLQWAEEIIVVDSFSTDGTPELARPLATRVIQHEYVNSAAQKNWIIPQATHDWIFLVDADERCTPELAAEVRQVLAEGPRFDAYWIYRRNFFLGKEIRHSGWNSDKVIRLFQKSHRYKELTVHAEVVVPSEKVGRLKGRFVHYTIDSLDQFFEKRMRYAAWSSADLDRRGVKASGLQILGHGTWNFFRQFVLRLGFLDGVHGLVLAILYSYYTSAKYIRLWERQLPPNPRRGILNQGAVRSAR
jgi:glycosyltransferase involved in cell wall biosynthesis